jgi:hypothetical protein
MTGSNGGADLQGGLLDCSLAGFLTAIDISYHSLIRMARLALGPRPRLPGSIWATLDFVAILGMSAIGYHAGQARSGRSLAILALVLAVSAVMTLIADIDRPQEGLLRVSPQPLMDLQRSVSAPRA